MPSEKITFILLLIIISLPVYFFSDSIFFSFFNFCFYFITTAALFLYTLAIYYYLLKFPVKRKFIKNIATFSVLPLLLINLLLLYVFIFDKDYKFKDLTVKNFKKPLIIWLEKQLDSSQQEKGTILAGEVTSNDRSVGSEEYIDEDEGDDSYYRRKASYEEDYGDYENYQTSDSDYHYVEGYTRDDGTEVDGYVRGDPDGVEENNIEYMRDNGDEEGLEAAFSSLLD